MDSNHMSKISQGVQDPLRHELEFLRDEEERCLREEERCLSEEREAIQALNMFPLYDDALEMIHINDDTYSYPTAPPSFQLLGLMDNDNTLWSFLRLLRLHKSIQERIAPQSNIRLLDDGMLDATPKSQEDKRISHRNAQYPRLLSLPVEVRNQIFTEAIGGFSIFVKSKRIDFEDYTHQEMSQITTRIRFLNPSNQTPLHEAWLQVQKENPLTSVTVSNHTSTVVITRTNSIHGSKENNPFFALQSTCRQLYTETALLPFSRFNRFWYYDDRALSALKKRITPGQYRAITKLFFHVKTCNDPSKSSDIGDFDLKRIQNLSALTGLKHIQIAVLVGKAYKNEFPIYLQESLKIAALTRIQAGLGPRIRELAPEGVELAFEFYESK